MMPAAGSEHPAQPQVPMEVGRNLLTLDPQRALGSAHLDTQGLTKPSPPDHGGTGLTDADSVDLS